MKITGPRAQTSTAPARRAGAARATEFDPVSAPEETPAPAVVSNASASANVASVDALLALQAADEAPDAASRAAKRAADLLDLLDGLKLSILEGGSVAGRMSQLAAATRRARDATGDPKLESLLDEVEVRAAVELAKHAAA